MTTYLLSETASGYSLFQVVEADVIATQVDSMQMAIAEYSRFSKMVKLAAFSPFRSAEHALEDVNMLSEGVVSDFLQNFLESNLPMGKGVSLRLGVHRDPKYKSAVSDALDGAVSVIADDNTDELLRGVRMHIHHFIAALSPADVTQAQLGIAHSYSRSKVKFNVHKSDNMIIQAIALLDQLDKDINTFAMRMREWYSWHFPELVKVVPDNIVYARIVCLIKDKSTLSEEALPQLTELLDNEQQAQDVLDAARSSMGTDISEVDLINIDMFAGKVVRLAEYRKSLHDYLVSKMSVVAPNLAALIGEQVGARLISHAGSLTSLAKYPASTVQILGAEKALFRALKTKGKTPKYGLLYHSSFIGRAKAKNKGRISRYLANKCSIASRMDCFSDISSDVFGRKLREQVEERLEFYDSGTAPRKNLDVMREASKEAAEEVEEDDDEPGEKKPSNVKMEDVGDEEPSVRKKTKKIKTEPADDGGKSEPKTPLKTPDSSKKSKKEKKDKKRRKSDVADTPTSGVKAEKSSSKKQKKRKRTQ